MAKTVLLIDGNSLINRAYYAIPNLSTAQGEPTNGVYGFLLMLFRLMDDYSPDHICVAFDVSAPTFRHKQYDQYKATRSKMPEDLRPQLDTLKEVLDALGVSRLELEGYEADDVLGTAARLGENQGHDVYVVTGDRDALQLVTDKVKVILTRRGIKDTLIVDERTLKEEFSVTPGQVKDLKGLMGDSSDNIPGVPGVGEKTALKLLQEFPTLEDLYANLDKVKGKLQEKLAQYKEQAFFSRELATIRCDVPIDVDFDGAGQEDPERLRELFRRLEFTSFLDRLPQSPTEEKVQTGKPALKSLQGNLKEFQEAAAAGEVSAAPDLERKQIALAVGEKVWVAENVDRSPDVREAIRSTLEKASCVRCTSVKELLHLLHAEKDPIPVEFDLELAAYLHDSGSRQDVKALAAALGLGSIHGEPGTLEYLGASVRLLAQLHKGLEAKLREAGLWELYHDLELPLAYLLAQMEHTGILVNREKLEKLGEELDSQSTQIAEQIYAEAGERFNINSPKQLGVILFEKLGLPVLKRTKTGPSTSAEVLEQLSEYEIVNLVLEYRQVEKLRSTYADALVQLISPETGRIHTTFHQTVTATGRLSSSNPNLQNIPVRTSAGRRIREAFIAPEGCVLMSADYSQIELRVLAHISGDEALMEAFRSGRDIHAQTASEVFGVPLEEVSDDQRSAAKAINFGIVYGISSFGLAKGINLTRAEAQAYIDRYFERYPKVKEYMDATVRRGTELGYVTTILQRRRYLPDLRSRNYTLRSFAARMAMNSPIQGSAADIIKLAMLKVDRALKEAGLKAKLLLQVHDELVLEVPREELAATAEVVQAEMENAVELAVPLLVEVKVGENWRDCEALKTR
ncbi:MAG TPA: DNA polymerase I [Firmicutes bacterium]|nr:DNA polymerase I [Bacillota bacterium]